MIRKLGKFTYDSQQFNKDNAIPLYLDGEFKSRDVQSNYAYYVDMPSIFEAYGKAVFSGNWRMVTSISNGYGCIQWQIEQKPRTIETNEWWEFWGLVRVLITLNNAYESMRFGNHGIGDDKAVLHVKNEGLAQILANEMDSMLPRINELLNKFPEA